MSGSLVIKPLQAKLTRDTDTFSKMDPYCQVVIGGQTVKGKVCSSGGKNPHWDDSISVKRTNESVLHVEVNPFSGAFPVRRAFEKFFCLENFEKTIFEKFF